MYVVALISIDGRCQLEIHRIIRMVKTAMVDVTKKNCSIITKFRIFLVISIALYEVETSCLKREKRAC